MSVFPYFVCVCVCVCVLLGVDSLRGGLAEGNRIPQFFDVVFHKKTMEQQRADPSLPQRYQSRPSKTEALVCSVSKQLVTKLKDKMHNPFASLQPMPPGSVIVSGVESGDQLAQTDTSIAPHVLPPSDRSKSDCHLSTFVALSP